MFEDDFIILKIDIEAMENGAETAKQLRDGTEGGIPWLVILDADGQELINSDGPDGNIGCPITEQERAYFVSMIEKSIQHAPESRIKELADALEAFAKPNR